MRDEPVDAETMNNLRHDIKNQLSNILLALDTLKYETPQPSEDFTFCVETIFTSAAKINELLNEPE
jgi:nitrogen fixation/metabolism regulation signal transduction histidine kinase